MNKIFLISILLLILYIIYLNIYPKELFKGFRVPKIRVPKPPKFKLIETKVTDKKINTGSKCDSDTLFDLKKRYKNYKKNECDYSQWIINPERCPASKKYLQKLNQFTENALKDSLKDTDKHLNLLEERIENDEYLNLYPINNYDFDYKTAIKKKYNVFKLGLTNKPTIQNLIDSPGKMKPYISALLDKKYPNKNTISGISDVILDDEIALEIKNEYNDINKVLPYPSFRKDYPECRYPTTGEHSSSYFIKSGTCKTTIKTKKDCEKKGYKWIENKVKLPESAKKLLTFVKNKKNSSPKQEEGICYKPRFSYIDNSAKDTFGKFGLGPSMLNDISNFSPDKIFNILAGYTVDGSGLLPCIDR